MGLYTAVEKVSEKCHLWFEAFCIAGLLPASTVTHFLLSRVTLVHTVPIYYCDSMEHITSVVQL